MDIATLNLFSVSVLLILIAFTTWIDLNEHRIPNGIVMYGLIVGFSMAALASGAPGLGSATAGMIIGGALLLPYYALGGMGAGDVKLMAMIGVYLGPKLTVAAVFLTLLSGAMLGVVFVCGWRLAHSAMGHRLIGTIWHTNAVRNGNTSGDDNSPSVPRFPYALAMLIGTSGALFWFFQLRPAVLS